MQYLLNGGGHEMRSLSAPELCEWMRGQGVQNLVIIAFAMAEQFWQQAWEQPHDFLSISGVTITSLTMTNFSLEQAKTMLLHADAIFMPGGMPAILEERLEQTGVDRLLRTCVTQNSLKCIGGASAGAMVLGKMYGTSHKPGLNLVPDHIIDVHFSSRDRMSRLQEVIDDNPQLTGVGIDEDTTLLLDTNYQPRAIFGAGTVTYYKNHETMRTYDSNTTFDRTNS